MFNLVKQLFGGHRDGSKRRAAVAPPPMDRGLPPHQIVTNRNPATDLLDNPSLRLDNGQDDGFDPYNTGTFNRSGSWERINKRRNG